MIELKYFHFAIMDSGNAHQAAANVTKREMKWHHVLPDRSLQYHLWLTHDKD